VFTGVTGDEPINTKPSNSIAPERDVDDDGKHAESAMELLQAVAASGLATDQLLASLNVSDSSVSPAMTGAALDRESAMRHFVSIFGGAQSGPTEALRTASPTRNPAITISPSETAAFQDYLAGIHEAEFSDADYDRFALFLDKTMQLAADDASVEGSDPASPKLVKPGTEKERRFLTTLKEVQRCFESAQLPWFVTCGTALGCIREGRFIPHDDDIDIGIHFTDLVEAGSGPIDTTSATQVQIDAARTRALDVLAHIGNSSRLVCFDVLGAVERGFQLRLQDPETGVLVDVNVYYTDLDDTATATGGGGGHPHRFVWTATHYAESAKRKHGMYRYRNSFPLELRETGFYDLRVRCPTEQYLVEYFGTDWRTPKVFNYDQGLAGEYRNIIPE
jgi:hypothetical protein